MNFAEKCNNIFGVLGCTNAEIARESQVDPSLISRFRTGSRQPRATSLQFRNFCKGIILFAEKNALLERLIAEYQLPGNNPPEEEICEYLVRKESGNTTRHKRENSNVTYTFFSEKLNAIMNMLDMSNIRLARALNVDTSLISRFRNGLRTPPKNSSLILSICNYFYKVIKMNDMEQELFEILGKPSAINEFNTDEIIDIFKKWLSDDDELSNTGIMDNFLEKMDTLKQVNIPQSYLTGNILPPDIFNDFSYEYLGIHGLRQAALRFLGTVAMSDNHITLKLYSDQNMNWLSSDPIFVQQWCALMHAVLLKKHSIKIIHNIDRNLNEMLIGIEKWLPLYMSGLVEGYCCKNSYDRRFSHTLFIASGLAAIHGSHVFGTEENGIYKYASETNRINYYEKQADAMLEISKPLIQVFQEHKSKDYYFLMGETSKILGNTKRLLLSPSLATMPAGLLKRMLIRSNIDADKTESILEAHGILKKRLEKELKAGHVLEYIVFPEDDALFNGKVKLNLSETFSETSVYYTPDEYSEHIQSLITLLENDSYEIIPMPDSPFANIQMEVKDNTVAVVLKSDQPVTAFRFSHPLMCKAISEYIDIISKKSTLHINSKNDIFKFLSKLTH